MAARSLNKVVLIGNLTRDPELRYTPQGTPVCSFGMATNREWVDNSGQKQEDAEFHNIVAWNKLGEICSNLLYKGRKVYVEGRLSTRAWTGQDEVERKTTEIVIDEMIAFGQGKQGQGGDDFSSDLGGSSSSSKSKSGDDDGGDGGVDTSSMMPKESASGGIDIEEAPKSEKSEVKKEGKKDLAEEVADDIPF